ISLERSALCHTRGRVWRFPVGLPAVSASATSALPESVYRQPGFLPFLISRVLAMFAVQILAVVVAWQVYDLTRDPLSLAYVGLAQFIPMLVLLMPAGDLIDRYDRKRILILSWGVEAICAAALLWLSLSGGAVVWFYGVLVLYGCARAFTGPALSSLLPQIVPRERLAAAIAANSMIVRGSTIAGPVFGGGLYALGGGALRGEDAGAGGNRLAALHRRHSFHPLAADHPRHHFPGPVRRAAGRRGGPAAHLCPGSAGSGADRPGRTAQRHGHRRGGGGLLSEHQTLQPARGHDHVPGGGAVRRGQPGVRPVRLVLAVVPGTAGSRRGGH